MSALDSAFHLAAISEIHGNYQSKYNHFAILLNPHNDMGEVVKKISNFYVWANNCQGHA